MNNYYICKCKSVEEFCLNKQPRPDMYQEGALFSHHIH